MKDLDLKSVEIDLKAAKQMDDREIELQKIAVKREEINTDAEIAREKMILEESRGN